MIKKEINIGIIGIGTVGSGVIEVLEETAPLIEERMGFRINIKKIADKDINAILRVRTKEKEALKNKFTQQINQVVEDEKIDIIVELIGGYEPAKSIIKKALQLNKAVVTANKAVLSKYWDELIGERNKSEAELLFEGSVAAAIPILSSLVFTIPANPIKSIIGILNGTCNYILTKMEEKKMSFDEALKEAQELGYAERDPSLDIEGYDTAHKLFILSRIAFGNSINIENMLIEGIRKIEQSDITYAKEFGYKIKLLGIAKKINGKIDIRVHPTMIKQDCPLASVKYATNAVIIEGEFTGPLLFCGEGAGRLPTAAAVVSDIIKLAENIASSKKKVYTNYSNPHIINLSMIDKSDIESRYYVKFLAKDRPGVLASISSILAAHNISIAAVIQKEPTLYDDWVYIIMLTHKTKEASIQEAIEKIDKLAVIKPKSNIIRCEENINIGKTLLIPR